MQTTFPDLSSRRARLLGVLRPRADVVSVTDDAILAALRSRRWCRAGEACVTEIPRHGETVCIVVSDHTRRTCTHRVLPVLLGELTRRGCALEDMSLLVASGVHRPPTPAELETILGATVMHRFAGRIHVHDADDDRNLVAVGQTRSGHRVRVNRRAMDADRRILLGAAAYHYHAGFGGGRKSLVPGLAARATIAHTHSLTLDPGQDRIDPRVAIGRLDGNPVSEAMLECARMCRPDAVINTVVCPGGELAGVFAGDLDRAHRAACRLAERVQRADIPEPADFVLAGAAKASNWIQAHKALYHASRAAGTAGRIVLAAPCPDGIGNERFRYWVKRTSVQEMFRGLREQPEILGQTALSTRMRGPRTILVSTLSARDAGDLGIETAPDTLAAIDRTLGILAEAGRSRPTYYLMPEADAVVPFLSSPACGTAHPGHS